MVLLPAPEEPTIAVVCRAGMRQLSARRNRDVFPNGLVYYVSHGWGGCRLHPDCEDYRYTR